MLFRSPDDTATVFGPYTNKGEVETVIKAVRETFGLRGCSDHKYAGRARPCLDYDMGLCSAPCTGEVDAATYRERVADAERFFAGETGVLAGPMTPPWNPPTTASRSRRCAARSKRCASAAVSIAAAIGPASTPVSPAKKRSASATRSR